MAGTHCTPVLKYLWVLLLPGKDEEVAAEEEEEEEEVSAPDNVGAW